MLLTKRCNICGGIINPEDDIYEHVIKQHSGTVSGKIVPIEVLLICKNCNKDIVKTIRSIGSNGRGDIDVLPGIPER